MQENSLEKMRLVILQADEEAAEQNMNQLTAQQVDVQKLCVGNLTAVESTVRHLKPDVLLIDRHLYEQNTFVVQSLQDTVLAIMTQTSGTRTIRPDHDNGDALIFTSPLDYRQIVEVCQAKLKQRKKTTIAQERRVTDLLHRIGIPTHLRGYAYIRDSVLMSLEDQTLLNSITKSLYPAVAKKHNTQPGRLERAMRYAVGVAWRDGDLETIHELFACMVSSENGAPSNGQMVSVLTEYVQQNEEDASITRRGPPNADFFKTFSIFYVQAA